MFFGDFGGMLGLKPMKWVEEDWEVCRGDGRMILVEGRRSRNMGSKRGNSRET